MILPELEVIRTDDGYDTLHLPGYDENYHSTYGAYNESMHVFIKNGLNFLSEKTALKIYEAGFGTGLNCLLTHMESKGREIEYHAIDLHPLPNEIVDQLNFVSESKLLKGMHEVSWNVTHELDAGFKLYKYKGDIKLQIPRDDFYDLVYFDAFGPQVQPDLWEKPVLRKMHNCLKKNGVLVTYCAKGIVKRLLRDIGFMVESLAGPPGKREMIRAIK